MANIYSPTLFVDLEKVRSNIEVMNLKAHKNALEFRPHFKTHQSIQIGEIFKELGIKGITVSSTRMASYFADASWNDITIAFPVNILAIEEYNRILKKCKLKTLISDTSSIPYLDANLSDKLGLYIDIDPGYGRSGLPASDTEKIKTLISLISNSDKCYLAGFYSHAGQTYTARSKQEVLRLANNALTNLAALKINFPDIPICFGDTPSCSVLDNFGPVDQISPGNFVFYDWMQVQIGSCCEDDIAIALYCPVIQKKDDYEILIHGGAVHFSKEFILNNEGEAVYGVPAETKEKGWGKIIEGNYLKSLSQEHGTLVCTPAYFNRVNVGDLIPIFPVHSCLTADLMGSYRSFAGGKIDHVSATNK